MKITQTQNILLHKEKHLLNVGLGAGVEAGVELLVDNALESVSVGMFTYKLTTLYFCVSFLSESNK